MEKTEKKPYCYAYNGMGETNAEYQLIPREVFFLEDKSLQDERIFKGNKSNCILAEWFLQTYEYSPTNTIPKRKQFIPLYKGED